MSSTTLTLTDEGQNQLNVVLRKLSFIQTALLDRVDSESEPVTMSDGYGASDEYYLSIVDVLDHCRRELHGVLLNEIHFCDHDDHATVKRGHARNPLEADSDEGKGRCCA